MPLSILFAAVAIIYFAMSFDFSKAVKLGILAGVLSSVAFSLIMALILLITRFIRRLMFTKRIKSEPHRKMKMPIKQDPTIYEKKHQSIRNNNTSNPADNPASVVETFMLLMDRELAYEVSLTAISDQKMADVMKENEKEKSIQLRTDDEEINIKISSLTKHTAQVLISSTIDKENIRKIITILKEKEHSFMQY